MLLGLVGIWIKIEVLELNMNWIVVYIIMKNWMEFEVPELHMYVKNANDIFKFCLDNLDANICSWKKTPCVRFRGASCQSQSNHNA